MSIIFDLVREDELGVAHKIEAQGYPEDEAGSLETFRYRQKQAPELFLGAYLPGPDGSSRELIAYVCSTLSADTALTHASMSTHVPEGSSVCLHSVCVAPSLRRKRVGLRLLNEYIARLSAFRQDSELNSQFKYERVLLITHEELRGFYERAGFEWVGQSAVVHGARPWFEMRKGLRAQGTGFEAQPTQQESVNHTERPHEAPPGGLPPGLWEALQRPSTRPRPVSRLLADFPHPLQDVLSDIGADASSGSPRNKFDLLCPRPGCGSVILNAGVGCWVESASVQLELSESVVPLPEYLGALPPPPETAQWWLITPNAMAFENIGFSRAVQGLTGPGGRTLKLLACAECDLGPLGWCEEGGMVGSLYPAKWLYAVAIDIDELIS